MTETLTASDLWIDGKQGIGRNDCAFGYIGTDEGTQDEDGDDCDPEDAVACVAGPDRDGMWVSIDLKQFEGVALQ